MMVRGMSPLFCTLKLKVLEVPTGTPPKLKVDGERARRAPALGVTELEAVEAGPVPAEFVAVTLKTYVSPLVSPETLHEVAPEVVHVWPPFAALVVSVALTV